MLLEDFSHWRQNRLAPLRRKKNSQGFRNNGLCYNIITNTAIELAAKFDTQRILAASMGGKMESCILPTKLQILFSTEARRAINKVSSGTD